MNKKTINLKYIVKILLSNWYWFVISVFVCVLFAYVASNKMTPKFEVSSTVLIRSNDRYLSQSSQLGILSLLGMGSGQHFDDDLEFISSKAAMKAAVEKLDLQIEYRSLDKHGRMVAQYPNHDLTINCPNNFLDTIKAKVVIKLSKKSDCYIVKVKYRKQKTSIKVSDISEPFTTCAGTFSINSKKELKKGDKYQFIILPEALFVEKMLDEIMVERSNKSAHTISIHTITDVPNRALDVIHNLIDAFNRDAVYDNLIMSDNVQEYIDARLQSVTEALDSLEVLEEKYKTDNKVISLSDEAVLYLQAAQEYEHRQAEIETQLNLIDYVQNFVTNEDSQYAPVPVRMGINDASLIALIDEYNRMIFNRMKKMRTATQDNPIIMQIDVQLAQMRQNIINSVASVKDGLLIMKRDLRKNEYKYDNKIDNVPAQERQYVQIKRQKALQQEMYILLFQKREENAFSMAPSVMPAKIIDEPSRSFGPVQPNTLKWIFFAVIIGVLLPFVVLFTILFVNLPLLDYKSLELNGIKVVEYFPHNHQISGKKSICKSQTKLNRAFERLIVKLCHELSPANKKEPKIILVTSDKAEEGKSFIARNLTDKLNEMGKTATMLDSLSNKLILQTNDEITKELKQNAGNAEYLIIDSKSLSVSADSIVLGKLADITLFVVREGKSDFYIVEKIQKLTEDEVFNNLQCVVCDCCETFWNV